jgi:formamidopyrimidine-DNA glycosylase
MPELPEVETTIRYLLPVMQGKAITDLTVSNQGSSHFNREIVKVRKDLIGVSLKDLTRIGKWMLFDFGKIKAVGHLRMSGRYTKSQQRH